MPGIIAAPLFFAFFWQDVFCPFRFFVAEKPEAHHQNVISRKATKKPQASKRKKTDSTTCFSKGFPVHNTRVSTYKLVSKISYFSKTNNLHIYSETLLTINKTI